MQSTWTRLSRAQPLCALIVARCLAVQGTPELFVLRKLTGAMAGQHVAT
jgi:hypothetical protein